MTDAYVCQRCGAPWQPDITGACRFCRAVAPPPTAATEARPGSRPGTPGRFGCPMPAGPGSRPGTPGRFGQPMPGGAARPTIDADVLCQRLRSTMADPAHPLGGLAAALHQVAGDRCHSSGEPVQSLQLTLDDWQYQATSDHDDVTARAVHTVRGIVLKTQPLAFDEWLACVAAHLSEFAATHPHVYEALVALDRP